MKAPPATEIIKSAKEYKNNIFQCYFLYWKKYKSRTLIEIIIITALVTGIINYIFFPNIALCGASGIVFAFIILASFTGFKDGEIPLTFILVATIYIGQQIYNGITVNDNVSQMAHITGGLVGSITGYILNKKTVTP